MRNEEQLLHKFRKIDIFYKALTFTDRLGRRGEEGRDIENEYTDAILFDT